jgi:hypothetical protein
VNDAIAKDKRSVSYCSVADVTRLALQARGPIFLAKIDLKDAYRMVPIKKEDWVYLGAYVSGSFLIDRCLPMGAASSCQIFQRVSDSLRWIFMERISVPCSVFNYLDDFLIVVEGYENSLTAMEELLHVGATLGLPIATEKTIHPCTSLTFLGIGIDAANFTVYIPEAKRFKTIVNLKAFLDTRRPRLKRWQKILGQLNHLSDVIVAGRTHLHSLYSSLRGVLSSAQHVRRRISAPTR